jgi:hypothetical protein
MVADNPARSAILDGPFSFAERPEPIAGDLRMSWGIAVLLLSLLNSRGKKANFQKLQFLAHAVRVSEGRDDVRRLLGGQLRPSQVSVRIEPWLNRAVALAHSLKLVSVDRGKSVALTQNGISVAKSIAERTDILSEERLFLLQVAPRLTDTLMNKVWRMEDLG